MKKIIATVIALAALAASASNTVFQTRFIAANVNGGSTVWTNTFRSLTIQSIAVIGADGTQGTVQVNGTNGTNAMPTVNMQSGYGAVTNVQWTFSSAPWSFQSDTVTTTFTNGTIVIGGFVPQ